VIYPFDPMRACSKSHCSEPAVATLALRYERRHVAMVDLLPERDPNHMELCADHADRLVPPIGWVVEDERTFGLLSSAPEVQPLLS
jgi:hypothetical protein